MNLETPNAKRLHDVTVAKAMSTMAVEYMPGVRILEWVPSTPAPVVVPK